MRGARLFVSASLLLCASCSAPPPAPAARVPEAPPEESRSKPGFRLDFPQTAVVTDHLPGGGLQAEPPAAATPGVVRTSVELPPKRESTFEDVLKLQKEVVARHPASDDEKLRLSLLHAGAGNLEEAERLLSTLRTRSNRLAPYVAFFLSRQLGDHREAGKLLAQFADEERTVTGFVIERVELVARVRRFRDYTAAEHDRVAPGGDVHLYVEPRNFALQRAGDKHTFHLRYEWKLLDDRGAEQPVPAWEKATVDEREDRISSNGPVTEFYQSFHLPLPANLAAGRYRVRISVTDVVTGKSDQASVPITVTPVGKAR